MPALVELKSAELRPWIARWAALWDLPGLEERVDVSFSSRFRTSLGRCAPASGEIRLAAFLLDGPQELLREALCHEAAHAAVHELHRRRRKPHGPEWRELMQAAGFEARARVPAALIKGLVPPATRARNAWDHRCPVCHASRVARTAVPRWRCAACRNEGLDGRLVITKLPKRGGAGR